MRPRRRRRRYHRLARHISKQLNLSLLPPARTTTNFSPQYARAREADQQKTTVLEPKQPAA
jgi:hypothetical protein